MPRKSLKTKCNMYKIFGITLKEWAFITFVVVLSVLVIGMITAYYQNMEKKVVENETNVKWLRKQNIELQTKINTISDSIIAGDKKINVLETKNLEYDKKNKAIMDSLKKIKQRYNEIGKRVDSLDVDGIRRYFSDL